MNPTTSSQPIAFEVNRTFLNEFNFARARRVSWGALLSGLAIVIATMAALMLLGFGIGMAVIEPGLDPESPTSIGIGSSLFTVTAQLIALFAGAYAATRLASVVSKQKAMLYGAIIWALSTVGMAYLASTTSRALVSGAYGALNTAVSTAGSAASAMIPDNIDLPNLSTNNALVNSLPASVQERLQAQGLTAEEIRGEASAILNQVVSEREVQQAQQIVGSTVADIIRSPGDAGADIDAMITQLVGQNGVFSPEDRQEAVTLLESRLGVTQQEATQIFNRWETTLQQAANETEQALATARAQAIQTADAATDAIATAAFIAFIASLLGLGAAILGGLVGRIKRDDLREEAYSEGYVE